MLIEMKTTGRIGSYTNGVLRALNLLQQEQIDMKSKQLRIEVADN